MWMSIASSSDGTKLVAVDYEGAGYEGGYVYTSTDSGVTWHEQLASGARPWWSVASSADGTKLIAVSSYEMDEVYVYTSVDSGITWQGRPIQGVTSVEDPTVASSADGRKLVAALGVYEKIYTSDDYGETWTTTTVPGGLKINLVSSSSDGTKLVAGKWGTTIGYVSDDSGATWTMVITYLHQNPGISSPRDIVISGDGSRIVTGSYCSIGGYIYSSVDLGATWNDQAGAGGVVGCWEAFATSSDGSKIVALTYEGEIFLGSVAGAGTSTFNLATLSGASQSATNDTIKNTIVNTSSETCYTLDEPSIRTLSSSGVTLPETNINILGGIAFNISCVTAGGSSDVELALGASYADTSQLRAYKSSGATLTDISDQVTFTNRDVNGTTRTVISYGLTDGGNFDEDSEVNGTIVDPIYVGEVLGATATTPTTTDPATVGGTLANTGTNTVAIMAGALLMIVTSIVVTLKGLKHTKRMGRI